MQYLYRARVYFGHVLIFNLFTTPLILAGMHRPGGLSLLGWLLVLGVLFGNSILLFYNIENFIIAVSNTASESEDSDNRVQFFD